MKSFGTTLAFAGAASAAAIQARANPEAQCCFGINVNGAVAGSVGQLEDGQNRVGGGFGGAQFCYYPSTTSIVDASGRGCIATGPTSQYQCDAGLTATTATSGITLGPNGSIEHNGSAVWYECNSGEGYNLYTSNPGSAATMCSQVTLNVAGGNCSAPASSSSASSTKPASSSSVSAASSSASKSSSPVASTSVATSTVVSTSTKPASTSTVSVASPTTLTSATTQKTTQTVASPTTLTSATTQKTTQTVATPTTLTSATTQKTTQTVASPTTVTAPVSVSTQVQSCVPSTVTVTVTAQAPPPATVTVQPSCPPCASGPAPSGSAPSGPAPSGPAPSGSVSSAPSPSVPAPTGPAPAQSTTIQTYACNPAHSYPNGASCISTAGTLSLVTPSATTSAPVQTYACNPAHSYPNGASCVSTAGTLSLVTPSSSAPASTRNSVSTATLTSTIQSTATIPASFSKASSTIASTLSSVSPTNMSPGSTKATPSVPAATACTKPNVNGQYGCSEQCPLDLSTGAFEYPHLIQINGQNGYFGEVNATAKTDFTFDIPASLAGKTCNAYFAIPTKSQLVTADYTLSTAQGAQVYLSSGGKQVSAFSPVAGQNVLVSSGPCAAGKTVSYEMTADKSVDFRWFQDYNACALGLFVVPS